MNLVVFYALFYNDVTTLLWRHSFFDRSWWKLHNLRTGGDIEEDARNLHDEDSLQEYQRLHICPTEGVSMGNPLGPTFANFYMCNLENSVLPTFSLNWLDIIANQFNDILNLKEQFEQNSVLKFTSEIETKKSMPFLDVLIRKQYQTFSTSVYVKPTNTGDLLNFDSACPDRYKTGLFEGLLHRSFAISDSWESFHDDVGRIKQLLTNNNY